MKILILLPESQIETATTDIWEKDTPGELPFGKRHQGHL
jgi:hypothetical protein